LAIWLCDCQLVESILGHLTCDGDFAKPFDTRNASVERLDELAQHRHDALAI
jgi:hypothetical protein